MYMMKLVYAVGAIVIVVSAITALGNRPGTHADIVSSGDPVVTGEPVVQSSSVPDGFTLYSSEVIGLTFAYPAQEGVFIDEDIAIRSVSVNASGTTAATMRVRELEGEGSVEEKLTATFLADSRTCELALMNSTDSRDVYVFETSESPYSEDFDADCKLLSIVYAYPGNEDEVIVVSTGQTPPFSAEDTAAFFDTIQLLP